MKITYFFLSILLIVLSILIINNMTNNSGKAIDSLNKDIILNNEQYLTQEFYGESIIRSILLEENVEDVESKDEYIVVLNEEPAIKASKGLSNAINKVANEQSRIVLDLHNKRIPVIKKTNKASNTLLVKSAPSKLKELKMKGSIKSYYPNVKINTLLDNSVEYLEINDIWNNPNNPYTGKGVIIGIIDTGIDYTHPSLGGCIGPTCKVLGGYDFVNEDNDPMDDNFHGTHVASTVAGNDTNGLVGIAPGAKLVGLKVLGADGSGNLYDILLAYDYSVDLNQNGIPFENDQDSVDILSMSLGAALNSPDHPLAIATDDMMKKGILTVIAAGNNGPSNYTIGLPGSSKEALTVGASGNFYGRNSKLLIDGNEIESLPSFNSGLGNFSGPVFDAGYGENLSQVPQNHAAVVRRGVMNFNELAITAKQNDVDAVIIINSEDEVFNPIIFYNTSTLFIAIKSSDEDSVLSANEVSIKINFSEEFSNSVAPFSSRGPTKGLIETLIKPDVLAPGYYVCAASSIPPTVANKCFDGDYIALPGTSMATPHVSGFAALLLESKPDWDSFMLRDAIKSASQKLDYSPVDQGFGRVVPKNLFDENRSIIINGSLSFKPLSNITQNNITIHNPTASQVTYFFTSDNNIIKVPQQVIVNSNSYKAVSINASYNSEEVSGYVNIIDSKNNEYDLPYLVDPTMFSVINISVPYNRNNQYLHTFAALNVYDRLTNERIYVDLVLLDSTGNAIVYYPYSVEDSLAVMIYAYGYDYNSTVNDTEIYQSGDQKSFFSYKNMQPLLNFDFSNCIDHELTTNIDDYFGSFISITSPYGEFPGFSLFNYYDRLYNVSNLTEFKHIKQISKKMNLCIENMPEYWDYNLASYYQKGNELFINKFIFDNLPEHFEIPDEYNYTDSVEFGISDSDNIIYPLARIRYMDSNSFAFNSVETIQAINTSMPFLIHSNMHKGSFNDRGIEFDFYSEEPEVYLQYFNEQPSVANRLYEPFFSLNSYNYYAGKRYIKTDMRVLDGSSAIFSKYLIHSLVFFPDSEVLNNQPSFISNIYDLEPGRLNFYTNLLSESNNIPLTPDFVNSFTGVSFFVINQSDEYLFLHPTNTFFDYEGTIGTIDLTLPFTMYQGMPNYDLPDAPAFIPYANTLNSNFFNVTNTWHTTMDGIDANPPTLVDVDISFNNLRFVIVDEELSDVIILLDGIEYNYSVVGDPYSLDPITNYTVDHSDYFKITLPTDSWHKITIFANDTTGNWFNQSFNAKQLYHESDIDFYSDDQVDISDLYELIVYFRTDISSNEWTQTDSQGNTIGTTYDLNYDGKINILDLVLLVYNYS